MTNDKKVANRLAATRAASKLTQKDLATMLSELSGREEPLTVPTISSWETGRRTPSIDMYRLMARIFMVSTDYLMCLTDDPNGSASELQKTDIQDARLATVSKEEIYNFDGKPVFVQFRNYAHQDQWGIVNCSKNVIVLRDGLIKINDETIECFYIEEPYYSFYGSVSGRTKIDLAKIMNAKLEVWVEMKTSDKYIQGLYNGWYHNNETHTCLINGKGLTLPYDGLDVSYNAYMKRKY